MRWFRCARGVSRHVGLRLVEVLEDRVLPGFVAPLSFDAGDAPAACRAEVTPGTPSKGPGTHRPHPASQPKKRHWSRWVSARLGP